ncbi:MAG: hypothetical protein ACR2OJ_07160 [Hyphomicrobiales bacterium]
MISRRNVLLGGAALSAISLAPGVLAQSPKSHNLKIGDLNVSVFSDGELELPSQGLATNVPAEELAKFLVSQGLPKDTRKSDLTSLRCKLARI